MPGNPKLRRAALDLLAEAPRGRDHRLRITLSWLNHAPDLTLGFAPLPNADEVPRELVLSDILRPAGNPGARYKTLAYTDHLAAQRGLPTGQEALLLNQWGRVACSAFANVYAYVDGAWVTPEVSEGALPGIIRGQVLAGNAKVFGSENLRGARVVEGRIEVNDFLGAPILLSNSLRGVVACSVVPRSSGSSQWGTK